MFDRRMFLKSSGLALFAGGFLPNVFVRMAEAGTPAAKRVLVAVFQRGDHKAIAAFYTEDADQTDGEGNVVVSGRAAIEIRPAPLLRCEMAESLAVWIRDDATPRLARDAPR